MTLWAFDPNTCITFKNTLVKAVRTFPVSWVLFNSVNSIHDHNGLCFHARVFNSCYLSYFESVQTFISDFVFVYAMFGLIWWCFYQLVLHFQLRFTHLTMFTCRFYSSNALETSTYSVWICSLVSSTFICCYCQTYSTVSAYIIHNKRVCMQPPYSTQ